MRSHHCGNLNIKNLNEEVTICGWIHRRRDHGGVIFLDVRDTTGIVHNPSGISDIKKNYTTMISSSVYPSTDSYFFVKIFDV